VRARPALCRDRQNTARLAREFLAVRAAFALTKKRVLAGLI